jgi:hypothetical protein
MPINPDLGSPTCRNCSYHPKNPATPVGKRVPAPCGRPHAPLHAEVNDSETLLLLQAPAVTEQTG